MEKPLTTTEANAPALCQRGWDHLAEVSRVQWTEPPRQDRSEEEEMKDLPSLRTSSLALPWMALPSLLGPATSAHERGPDVLTIHMQTPGICRKPVLFR